jgi:hypothetical protein
LVRSSSPSSPTTQCHANRDFNKAATASPEEQRGEVITKLLNEANKQSEKTDVAETPVKEVAPAK